MATGEFALRCSSAAYTLAGVGQMPRPAAAARERDRGLYSDSGLLSGADSGGRRNAVQVVGEELSEFFVGGAEAEAFAGPLVEFGGDGLELGGGVLAEVGALGEVFAEQAVDVFVAAAL